MAKLAAVVDSLDAVPEAFRELYAERDGHYALDVDGVEDPAALKSALQKERAARAKAERDARAAAEKFADLDVDEIRRLQEAERQRKDGELISAGKVDELVNERIKRLQDEFTKEKARLEQEKVAAGAQLDRLLIDNEVSRLAAAKGVASTAIDDVIWRARQVFRRDKDGTVRGYSGETPLFSGKDATQPLSIEEWLGDLAGRAPHLFAPSTGAGAQPTGGKGATPRRPVREWTAVEKAAYIAEHGAEAYGRLAQEAIQRARAATQH